MVKKIDSSLHFTLEVLRENVCSSAPKRSLTLKSHQICVCCVMAPVEF